VLPENDVIQGPYFSDLMNQPQALRCTWQQLHQSSALEKIAQDFDRSRFERIVLTGMGGSYFGLHPLCIELAASGWTPIMVETSELIHYYPHLLAPSTLVIAVSQSGKSAETLRLLEMNRGRAPVIGITNWIESPLAQQANLAVVTAAGEEHSVACKTYVSTQMALQILGAALCNADVRRRMQEMEMAADLVEAYLRQWQSHVAEFMELLQGIRHLFLAGRGASLAAAQTGALSIKESTHLHAEGMSSAALRHGPFEMMKSGIFVGVFAGDARTRALNAGLVRDVASTGAQTVMFSEDAIRESCRLPRVPESLSPIVEILPVQMMTLAIAALANREAGKFERATKVTAVE
jgi:glutamine---fructose-6-phosphate transaminase (isomerizing)